VKPVEIQAQWIEIETTTDNSGPVRLPMVQAMWRSRGVDAMPTTLFATIKGCPLGSAYVVDGDTAQAGRAAVLELIRRTNMESATNFVVVAPTPTTIAVEVLPGVVATFPATPRATLLETVIAHCAEPWVGDANAVRAILLDAAGAKSLPAPTPTTYTVAIPYTVTPEQLCDRFVNLIECNGMSVSWLTHDYAATVEASKAAHERAFAADKGLVCYGSNAFYALPDWRFAFTYDDPNGGNGEGARDGRRTVAWADVERGLLVMARNYSEHFTDWMADEGDEVTADVFIQCVLFSEVVYG
jgi:hypothetical protein